MRRRSRAGPASASVKSRRRKEATRKRRDARKVRGRGTPAHDPDTEIARVIRERDEAREQQKATGEILRVIRTSPADVQPVFETIVRNAVSLCGSLYANVFRFDGALLHFVAFHQSPAPGASLRERHLMDSLKTKYPMRPDSSQVAGRVLLTKSVVRLEDVLTDPDYDQRFTQAIGMRRLLGVPILREGEPLSVIVAGWAEAGPIPKVQEELLKTFADQAVIAIENARLFEAEQQRSRELTESLKQQTATSEVLRVISSSPGDLQPVFDAMLVSATQLCQASYGTMWLHENDGQMRIAAQYGNLPEAFGDNWRVGRVFRPSPSVPTARVFETRRPVQIADLKEDRSYLDRDPLPVAAVEVAGIRSLISIPMLKDETVVGTLNIFRREVRPFTDKQIELVQNFAAQAVIAIENARLLNELRESLERQTATSEVLSVISSSPGELQPVFQAMLENATRICKAKFGTLLLCEGDAFRGVATHDVPAAYGQSGTDAKLRSNYAIIQTFQSPASPERKRQSTFPT